MKKIIFVYAILANNVVYADNDENLIYKESLYRKNAKPHRFTFLCKTYNFYYRFGNKNLNYGTRKLVNTEIKHRGTLLRIFIGLEKEYNYAERHFIEDDGTFECMLYVKALDITMNPNNWYYPDVDDSFNIEINNYNFSSRDIDAVKYFNEQVEKELKIR